MRTITVGLIEQIDLSIDNNQISNVNLTRVISTHLPKLDSLALSKLSQIYSEIKRLSMELIIRQVTEPLTMIKT